MIRLEYQIIAAVLLDLLAGDPRRLPHPVRLIGSFAALCESFYRKTSQNQQVAGALTIATVLAATGLTVAAVLHGAALIHPLLSDLAAIFILYTTIAAKDLVRHSKSVYEALQQNDIPEARKRVAMIVGRDTEDLDREEISRATIESVAESLVDGITAPLFFAVLGGPVGAILYKAVNTGDSMFGYKNERYKEFGRVAARLDDLANLIPARLTALLVPVASAILRLDPGNSFRILIRDRYKHASPNAGHTEAAVAGAFGIQLGGPSSYFGKLLEKPTIGDAHRPVTARLIPKANTLILVTSALALAVFLLLRLLVLSISGNL